MIEITSEPLHPEIIADKIRKDEYGAVVTFVGTVRNMTNGRRVAFLEIEPRDEEAESKLHQIVSQINQRWQLQDIDIRRRTGKLKVGETALVVAVAAPHRQEAFQACQYAVDSIKQGHITTEREIYETGES